MADISGINNSDRLDITSPVGDKNELSANAVAADQSQDLTSAKSPDSNGSINDAQRLQEESRITNQVETAQSRELGNDNKSQTEASRALGKVVDIFA